MRILIQAEAGEGGETPDVLSGFVHDIDYVVKTWLEHRIHHAYPRYGGYDDQDADLMDDWHILTLYYIRVGQGVTSALAMDDDGVPIEDLLQG